MTTSRPRSSRAWPRACTFSRERFARALLSSALDEADPDARHIAELLDGMPGAYERAHLGFEQAKARQTVSLDEL